MPPVAILSAVDMTSCAPPRPTGGGQVGRAMTGPRAIGSVGSRRVEPRTAAKAQFADALREVEAGGSVVITRHGKPVAVLVSMGVAEEVERLHAADAHAGLAGLVGRQADGEELRDGLGAVRRADDDGRSVPEFDGCPSCSARAPSRRSSNRGHTSLTYAGSARSRGQSGTPAPWWWASCWHGAHGSVAQEKWIRRIEEDILPRVTVLPFDLACSCGTDGSASS